MRSRDCYWGALLLMLAAPRSSAQQKVTVTSDPPAQESAQRLPAKGEPPVASSSEVHVSEYMTVDIVAHNDDLTNVLQKLAVMARRNIVPSKSINLKISATIYGVSFYKALEGLLKPNGLTFVEQDDFIYVYTVEEWQALEESQAERLTRIIYLDYVQAEAAAGFAKGLLSEHGEITFTKDLESSGGESGSSDAAGGVVNTEVPVYTPEVDEYSLTNAIVVHDFAENIERIESFLSEFDVKPAQVLIETTIIQTRLNEANAFGVDFALLTGVNFVDFFNFPVGSVPIGFKTVVDAAGNLTSPSLPNSDGFAISSVGNTGAGRAGLRAGGIISDDVGVFIRALDQVSDVSLLANPKILVLNRQRAKVLVGVKVGYLNTVVVENQVMQEISFIDTGVILDIRAFILRDGRVRLELMPKVSEVQFRETAGIQGIVQQIPDERIQTVSTDVVLPDGHTAVLGGMFREDTRKRRSQIPVLGDIPYAGALFRGNDDELDQFEVIFMIKATVLNDGEVSAQGERGQEYYDRVRVGSRFGLLPWSRERQSSRHNLEAERLARAGEYDRALWHIRRSLELNPLQPDAIQIREQLVAEPAWWPVRSMLERTINLEFHRQLDLVPELPEPAGGESGESGAGG